MRTFDIQMRTFDADESMMVFRQQLPENVVARAPTPIHDVTDGPASTIEEQETYALVERARSGDREAYAMLFDRFHDEIYRFAARRIGDPVAGQDAAAETFADAFKGIARYEQTGAPFEAWLYTIARRRIVDQIRTRARATTTPSFPLKRGCWRRGTVTKPRSSMDCSCVHSSRACPKRSATSSNCDSWKIWMSSRRH